MTRLILVCAAGAIGSGLRYLVVTWAERRLGDAFPWGVFAVNVVGSFLIATIAVFALTKASVTPEVRLTLATGLLGGFTTYSSFNQDTLAMIDRRLYGTALLYVSATFLACLAAGAFGTFVARRI